MTWRGKGGAAVHVWREYDVVARPSANTSAYSFSLLLVTVLIWVVVLQVDALLRAIEPVL